MSHTERVDYGGEKREGVSRVAVQALSQSTSVLGWERNG